MTRSSARKQQSASWSPGVPAGRGEWPGAGPSSASNCVTLPAQGQHVSGQRSESLARRRYQEGTLELRGNNWTVRYREDVLQPDGSVVRRMVRKFVGTKKEYPTRKLARRRADEIVSRVNRPDYRPVRMATFADFVCFHSRRERSR